MEVKKVQRMPTYYEYLHYKQKAEEQETKKESEIETQDFNILLEIEQQKLKD